MMKLFNIFGMSECPICGNMMVEIMPEQETDGQFADRIAGFSATYQCQSCGEIAFVEK